MKLVKKRRTRAAFIRWRRAEGTETKTPLVCVHLVLAPQWDAAADMGHEDRASRWVCAARGDSFTPSEQTALRASEVERVHALMDTDAKVGPGH